MKNLWLPFSANRSFHKNPRTLVSADGMYYVEQSGKKILDAVSGLWCVNAGHHRQAIIDAVTEAARTLDYAPAFHVSHPYVDALSEKLMRCLPSHLSSIFLCPSGSDAVETALKIALQYHALQGAPQRTMLIGRHRDYHGATIATTLIGGIDGNRQHVPPLMPSIRHMQSSYDRERDGFSRGLPRKGVECADELERMVARYGRDAIAAVIVEPVAGSTGVLPPPQHYLQRLQEICHTHGILFILDEIITGFGRLGTAFASQAFHLTPDIITFAKALTNGCAPLAGVAVTKKIYDTFMERDMPEHAIEFPHGFTWSTHPLACAAACATLDIYDKEDLFARGQVMSPIWQDALYTLEDIACVIDIRGMGLMHGIELEADAKTPGMRGFHIYRQCFEEEGLLVRVTGDTIALSPSLIIEERHISIIVDTLRRVLKKI
ncbi:MAG: aminotransferase class III-fold pyridoxal phosphate-dependent enzyme [Alphaproteobacteria bacterium GM7ARS4]|nr:aminotransferase class III-fold pyridoxal phosphate-dependent enzyme [Alphaproteobacteria bacterium GM7ARS4]